VLPKYKGIVKNYPGRISGNKYTVKYLIYCLVYKEERIGSQNPVMAVEVLQRWLFSLLPCRKYSNWGVPQKTEGGYGKGTIKPYGPPMCQKNSVTSWLLI